MRSAFPAYTGFETFRDSDISPYYRSELRRLSPDETWAAINARLLGLLRGIHARTLRGPVAIDSALRDDAERANAPGRAAFAALAHNAMLLALHPDHARRLMEEHGQDAVGRPIA